MILYDFSVFILENLYIYIFIWKYFLKKFFIFDLNLLKLFLFCKLMLIYIGVYNFFYLLSLLDSSCLSIGLVVIKILIIYMFK